MNIERKGAKKKRLLKGILSPQSYTHHYKTQQKVCILQRVGTFWNIEQKQMHYLK
jgi:hypothetical protein